MASLCAPGAATAVGVSSSWRRLPRRTTRAPAAAAGAHQQQRVVPRGPAGDGSDDAWWEADSQVPYETRRLFVREVAKGEAAMHSATAALLIAREDDALITNCCAAVALPVEPFLRRMASMADEIAAHHLPKKRDDDDEYPPPDAVVAAVASFLFDTRGLRVSASPAIRKGDVLEHPGVWEDPRCAYLNDVLTKRVVSATLRVGSPAALAIIFAEVWRQLLLRDAVGFAVSTDVDDGDGDGDGESVGGFPVVVRIIPMGTFSSSMALAHLNTCGSRALVLLLRQLKRAYWPWAWDTGLDDPRDGASGGGGGFLAAARAFLEETQEDGVAGSGSSGTRRGVDAATAAISAAAAHRLARGVWTSSGAGDLRRARAAAERLVVLCGSSSLYCPREKRDLAVLLVHCGELAAALDLLREYERDVKRGEASQADGRGTWQPSAAEGAAVEALVGVLPAVIAATEAAAAAVAADREGEGLGEGLEGGGIASGTRRKIPWALSPPSGAEGGGGESTWYRSPSVVVASPVAPQRRASLASARRPRAASALPSVSAVSSSSSSSIDIIDDIARAPVVVLGASGRTGAEVVRYCVSAGRPVRACTRSGAFDAATVLGDDALAAATVPWSSPLVTSARADVTQPDTLAVAVAGASMVIFAATAPANGANPDDVDHLGLVNAAAACIAADVPRLVVVSGAGVTKPQSPAYGFLNMFGRRMDAKVAGEDAVRALYRSSSSSSHSSHSSGSGGGGGGGARKASGASPSYTVVRPSGLLDGPPKGPGALAVNQGDEAAGFINRADVAACCVQAGDVAGAAGATFEVYDAGTAVATASLSVADILSDPKLAAAVALVTGQTFRRMMGGGGGGGDGVVTARERRGGDYASLLDGLHPDDEL